MQPKSTVTDEPIIHVIRSFPSTSTGGSDVPTPLHLKDLSGQSSGITVGRLLHSKVSLSLLTLYRNFPELIMYIIFEACLSALRKKAGRYSTHSYQMLVSTTCKSTSCSSFDILINDFVPHQLGVRVSGEAEVNVNAVRYFVQHNVKPDYAMLKLNFSTALNCLNRAQMLQCVQYKLPCISCFVNM
ncbi:hypothetical protein GJ496_000404 [Pomphorhynchus laevis]|nr:hypothetical protein GJ496_000404 [Pomphorhynchus laevis]